MGLFSRRRDASGLYYGDAPASAPGLDGAAPTAYTGQGPADHSQHGVSATPPGYPITAEPQETQAPVESPGYPVPPEQHGYPPPAEPADYPAAPGPQPYQMPPGYPADPPQPYRMPPGYPVQQGYPAPPPAGPGVTQQGPTHLPPGWGPAAGKKIAEFVASSAIDALLQNPDERDHHRQAAADIRRAPARRSAAGCLARVIALAVIVGGVAFAAMKFPQIRDAVSGVLGGSTRSVEPAAIGVPVTVAYDQATFEVTVFGAIAQPGGSWSQAFAGDSPQLIVDAQLHRVDAGTGTVRVLGWNWSVTEPSGHGVTGDIITTFEPSLDGPELAGGDTVRGFLSFGTNVTATTLSLRSGPAGGTLATWELAAVAPTLVTASVGTPAQGEISRPGFTVTISGPRTVGARDPSVHRPPHSGRYLAMDLRVVPNTGVGSSLGLVRRESFVFVPDKGQKVEPEFGAVTDGLSVISVDANKPAGAVLAFDTKATGGVLEMHDGAGRTVLTWRIKAG